MNNIDFTGELIGPLPNQFKPYLDDLQSFINYSELKDHKFEIRFEILEYSREADYIINRNLDILFNGDGTIGIDHQKTLDMPYDISFLINSDIYDQDDFLMVSDYLFPNSRADFIKLLEDADVDNLELKLLKHPLVANLLDDHPEPINPILSKHLRKGPFWDEVEDDIEEFSPLVRTIKEIYDAFNPMLDIADIDIVGERCFQRFVDRFAQDPLYKEVMQWPF